MSHPPQNATCHWTRGLPMNGKQGAETTDQGLHQAVEAETAGHPAMAVPGASLILLLLLLNRL